MSEQLYNGMTIEEVNRKYLENTLHCPFCGSTEIDSRGPMEGDADDGWQEVKCTSCGWSSTDTYKITGMCSPEAP
ncbi:MAG: hypothetical protein LWW75_07810 [Chlorobiales bacterium]|nr:hypothetical protein [Chlorobiales bacterium]